MFEERSIVLQKNKPHMFSTFRGKHDGPGRVARLRGINTDNEIKADKKIEIKVSVQEIAKTKVMLPSLLDLRTDFDFPVFSLVPVLSN